MHNIGAITSREAVASNQIQLGIKLVLVELEPDVCALQGNRAFQNIRTIVQSLVPAISTAKNSLNRIQLADRGKLVVRDRGKIVRHQAFQRVNLRGEGVPDGDQ